MKLTWWGCGCLDARGVHLQRDLATLGQCVDPPAWCRDHRVAVETTLDRQGGVIVLDLLRGRYEWEPLWIPAPGVRQLVACITPDDRLHEQDLGTVAGGTFRPRGGRTRIGEVWTR